MKFVEMDPEEALAAIEGHENVLEGEARKLDAFYRQFVCKSCGGKHLSRRYLPQHAFADETTPIPRATLFCDDCHCHFDPHSGLILNLSEFAIINSPNE